MVPDGMTYVAIRDIWSNGVRAATAGQRVHESAVTGPGAWLTDGVDVEYDAPAPLPRPDAKAPRRAWADYATSRGADAGDAGELGRDELIALVDGMDAEQATADKAGAAGSAAGRAKAAKDG